MILTFNLRLETDYLDHQHYPFNQRHVLALEETKESWQKKVALSSA